MKDHEIYKPEPWLPEIARPGCQDFLKCPSRVGDELKPYEGIKPQCVGQLKDRANKGFDE